MSAVNRRDFSQTTLGSLLAYSLLETVCGQDALANDVKPIAAKWLAELNDRTRDLRGQKLTQVQWQTETERLFQQVNLPDFLSYVDFDRLTKGLKFKDKGERAFRPQFPAVEGLPTELVFGHQMFALKKGRSVVPHGHNNMATAFLILEGEFHGRHYDRLEDEEDHMIIKPSIDQTFEVGEFSTVSDFKDNVHWFKATSETAYLFNIHVLNVDPQVQKRGRVYIDPHGEQLADGKVRATKLSVSEAYKLYG
jgi:hypothetical protein